MTLPAAINAHSDDRDAGDCVDRNKWQVVQTDWPLSVAQAGPTQQVLPADECDQTDGHAHSGAGETVVPAESFAEGPADQTGQDRADVDTHVVDGVSAVTPRVVGAVI